MLLAIVVILTALMALEMQIDVSQDNRIINPILGLVVTLLGSSVICRGGGPEARPLHIVHIVLYIACLLYVRAMLDFVFRYFF
jgi:hypothetical protein